MNGYWLILIWLLMRFRIPNRMEWPFGSMRGWRSISFKIWKIRNPKSESSKVEKANNRQIWWEMTVQIHFKFRFHITTLLREWRPPSTQSSTKSRQWLTSTLRNLKSNNSRALKKKLHPELEERQSRNKAAIDQGATLRNLAMDRPKVYYKTQVGNHQAEMWT